MPPESESFRRRVLPEQAGMRLDQCAAALADGISRTRIQRAIASGNMTLNGVVCTVPRTVVAEGDELVFEIPEEPAPEHVTPERIPLNILYEDEALMVIDKPAGMVVHPAAGNYTGTVVNALLGRSREIAEEFEETGDPFRPGIVHRLDKDTSGCLLVAKSARAMDRLCRMFAERKVMKTYAAIVAPCPKVAAAEIRTQIGRHPVNRKKMAVVQRGGKEALTRFTVMRKGRIGSVSAALLQVRILTGRTHQIRVHMNHIGHPLPGDYLYNPDYRLIKRQALHSCRLTFCHPISGKPMDFTAPIPDDFKTFACGCVELHQYADNG